MRTRSLVVVLVLVAGAGCSTLLNGDPSNRTLSPVPLPEIQEGTATAPPGVTGTVLSDPSALVNAHAAILATRSHRFTSEWTARYANGSLYGHVNQTARVARDREQFFVTFDVHGPHSGVLGFQNAHVELYAEGDNFYQDVTRNDTTRYSVGLLHLGESFHISVSRPNPRWPLAGILYAIEPQLIRDDSDSDASYRLVGQEPSRPPEFALLVDGKRPKNISFEAVVTEDGLVVEYRLAHTAIIGGEEIRFRWAVTYTDLGNTSVGRPAWVEHAARQS